MARDRESTHVGQGQDQHQGKGYDALSFIQIKPLIMEHNNRKDHFTLYKII